MTDINGKNQVIALLRRQPLSRVDLANQTGLVKSSLTKITQQLITRQLVEEVPEHESTAKCTKGRPKTLLRLVAGKNVSICCHLSIEGLYVILIDHTNKILGHEKISWDLPKEKRVFEAKELVAIIKQHGKKLCRQHHVPFNELRIVTVATQGKIAQRSGVIHSSQLFKERHFNFANLIEQELGCPAKIFNIAFCNTTQLQINYSRIRNFVDLLLAYGVGIGISIDDKIMLGPDGTAPEITHMNYKRDGNPCYCGAHGCCETYVTYRAIIQQIEDSTGKTIPGADYKEQLKYISTQVTEGNRPYIDVVNKAGEALGFIIGQFTTVWDIHDVILSGPVGILYDHLKPVILRQLNESNDFKFAESKLNLWYEKDHNLPFYGLIELTNSSYQV
ncbi:ROK family protein [Vibrio sp. CAIM 722]|uniref:ROK family protein n=1 Tax=Vibrio eleionomae TaxID=2653505 RepID=A0A7X4LJF3_9VIBR|nr:ROK family protein [Vibrio eleionomae]MZI93034.1 ROK family protein [Vibrio eleionomae]